MRVNEGSRRWQLEVLGSWQPSWSLPSDTVSSFAINFSRGGRVFRTHEVINCPMDDAVSASLHLASPYNVIQLNSRHTRLEKYFVKIKSCLKHSLWIGRLAIFDGNCLLDLMLKYWTLQEMETELTTKLLLETANISVSKSSIFHICITTNVIFRKLKFYCHDQICN